MDKKISNIKERILYITEIKGVAKEKFFNEIGMTYGSFKGKQKETALNSDAIDKILSIYTDIDANWLLTGNGEMLKTGNSYTQKVKGDGNIVTGSAANINIGQDKQDIIQLKKEIKELNKRLLEKDEQINKLINILSNAK